MNKPGSKLRKPVNNITEQKLLLILESVSPKTIWNQYENSRFCAPSNTNIKEAIEIENIIVQSMPDDFELIRISPLVPMGLYNILSGMSYDRSIQTSRRLEMCSDISVSLALEGLYRRKKHINNSVTLSSFGTILRPQSFYGSNGQIDDKQEKYKYGVPHSHFSIYANAIVATEKKEFFFAKKYFVGLIQHYIKIIKVLNNGSFNFSDVEVEISDMRHSSKILSENDLSLHEFRDMQLKERAKMGCEPKISSVLKTEIQEVHESDITLSKENNEKGLGLDLGYLLSIGKQLKSCIENDVRVNYRIGRSRGAGQYSTLAFSIFATTNNGKRIDIADGGITNRGNILLGNDTERCLVGGMGTSLIASLFHK